MSDRTVRVALERHWDASDANDFKVEHEIYREDAVLDYPQSGERISGRHNIQESRFVQPNKKRFTVRRIVGSGDLWVTEFILTYDGIPSCAVSVMEFREGLVAHETQYFADRFEPAPSRAHLVERAGASPQSFPRQTLLNRFMTVVAAFQLTPGEKSVDVSRAPFLAFDDHQRLRNPPRGVAMKSASHYRALASLCRQQAAYKPDQSWQMLSQAERWEHLAEGYGAS